MNTDKPHLITLTPMFSLKSPNTLFFWIVWGNQCKPIKHKEKMQTVTFQGTFVFTCTYFYAAVLCTAKLHYRNMKTADGPSQIIEDDYVFICAPTQSWKLQMQRSKTLKSHYYDAQKWLKACLLWNKVARLCCDRDRRWRWSFIKDDDMKSRNWCLLVLITKFFLTDWWHFKDPVIYICLSPVWV